MPNRTDLIKYYDDKIDVNFIKQLFSYDLFKSDNLNQLVTFTFNELKTIDSLDGSKKIDKWMQNWNIIMSNYYEVSEVLPYVLRDMMNKIEKIYIVTRYFRQGMLSKEKLENMSSDLRSKVEKYKKTEDDEADDKDEKK